MLTLRRRATAGRPRCRGDIASGSGHPLGGKQAAGGTAAPPAQPGCGAERHSPLFKHADGPDSLTTKTKCYITDNDNGAGDEESGRARELHCKNCLFWAEGGFSLLVTEAIFTVHMSAVEPHNSTLCGRLYTHEERCFRAQT